MPSSEVLVVLPPKEGFTPGAVGAIGLLVERLVRGGAPGTVLGRASPHAAGAPTFDGIPFIPVVPGFGLGAAAQYAAGVARLVRRRRPRLVEVHNWPEVALRLSRTGAPVTLILNNDPQTMRGTRTAHDRARLLQRLAGVATSSEWLRTRLLAGLDHPARRPTVLPNCIDVPPPPPPERERLILFAGRLVADKGADVFVRACADALPHLPGWRAAMIGADRFRPDSPETPFIEALRPAARAANVELLGHQPNAAVLAAMREAAIVAVPSRWEEPFGLVALEAMANGAALVCSPNGGLREVAGDTAIYASPAHPDAFGQAILDLARDVPRRTALAAAARTRAEGFGTPEAVRRLLAFRAGALG